jgi:hypothetical protein
MFESHLSRDEKNALQRVAAGLVIDPHMFRHLVAKGLVDQLLGGNRVSEKGKKLLEARH